MVKYTDETLKQLHSTILEMLIEFDRICRKYNIPVSYTHLTLPTTPYV